MQNPAPLKTVAIIGAGPAGLTAAYELTKQNVAVTIFEADSQYVGGISKTVRYKDFYFDIGGHRFFSKSNEVEQFWTEVLGPDMLDRPRSSRIFYNGKFFAYPLKPIEALLKLGVFQSVLCVLSFLKSQIAPVKNPKNFEDWVSNQFGKRLFNIFFKTYTEKVWGMNCREISADWAAQRIKGLSLGSAIWNAVKPKFLTASTDRKGVIKSLIDSFRYPRKGPGMMWERCAEIVKQRGAHLHMGTQVSALGFDSRTGKWQVTAKSAAETISLEVDHVISTAPMRELVQSISPSAPQEIIRAASKLRYRDFLTVAVMLKDKDVFDDNWIYIHEPGVKVGRVQNYKSWSPEMVPDPSMCCYGLEYFCFEGDGLWESSDADLIERAKKELELIGLAKASAVLDGCVVRQKKAYPVYDDHYLTNVNTIRLGLEKHYPGLHLIGRNGMHKYNNQDHAMMTAMLCAKNIIAGSNQYDVWQVNQDAEYHEAGAAGQTSLGQTGQSAAQSTSGLRAVPSRVPVELTETIPQ